MIDEASPGDAVAVIALWEACGLTRPWNDPRADFERAMAHEASTILIAREDDAIIGSVMVGDDGHRGWVYYLGVDPLFQRGGQGRALMLAAEDWLKARGCPKIQLMVRDENAGALHFYNALGYEPQPVTTLGKRID